MQLPITLTLLLTLALSTLSLPLEPSKRDRASLNRANGLISPPPPPTSSNLKPRQFSRPVIQKPSTLKTSISNPSNLKGNTNLKTHPKLATASWNQFNRPILTNSKVSGKSKKMKMKRDKSFNPFSKNRGAIDKARTKGHGGRFSKNLDFGVRKTG